MRANVGAHNAILFGNFVPPQKNLILHQLTNGVFPIRMGMNRSSFPPSLKLISVPHTHGDEPGNQ